MKNKDCFAYTGKNINFCSALDTKVVKNCKNCKFYRNDISVDEIEFQVDVYAIKKGKKNGK